MFVENINVLASSRDVIVNDEIVKEILPPDFNGGVLVSKNDEILFEKYYSYKDNIGQAINDVTIDLGDPATCQK